MSSAPLPVPVHSIRMCCLVMCSRVASHFFANTSYTGTLAFVAHFCLRKPRLRLSDPGVSTRLHSLHLLHALCSTVLYFTIRPRSPKRFRICCSASLTAVQCCAASQCQQRTQSTRTIIPTADNDVDGSIHYVCTVLYCTVKFECSSVLCSV